MSRTIYFENAVQVALYKCELSGQISDGHWENSRPLDHWKIMCDAWVGVERISATDPKYDRPAGINFQPKRRYNFAAPELLEVVGQRMLHYARLAKAGVSVELIDAMDCTVLDLMGEIRREIRDDNTGEYWDQKRAELSLFDCDAIEAIISDEESYTMADLRSDLRSMSAIVNAGPKGDSNA